MATIQKLLNSKGVSYRALIRRKGIKPITKVFPSKKLAEQFANRIEGDRGVMLAYGNNHFRQTFQKIASEYLSVDYRGQGLKKQTALVSFWVNLIGFKYITEVTTEDITKGITLLSSDLKNSTINRYKAALSAVFSYACRQYGLTQNPVKNIRSLPESRGRIRFLSDDERSRLFEACRSSQWGKLYLLVLLAITTGARRGELLGLEWNDIDFDRKLAYVKTTKNGEPKVLPLTDDVIIELDKFKAQSPTLLFNSEIVIDKPYCFNKLWKTALKKSEIEDFTFHSLRHTCASYLAMNGASLLEIADVLGHKQIQMTKRYSHLCIDHKQKLINRVLGDINAT